MKRPFLVLLALAASGGFAAWLVRTPHELREIVTACGAWVLGFWLAAAIQSRGPRRNDGDDEDEGEDEEDEGSDEEWDEDVDEDDAWDERDR